MEKLRFGIMTDLHNDVMPDAMDRMAFFIDQMNQEKVDFIIQLGDLDDIGTGAKEVQEGLKRFDGPFYHVFGNHDTDTCPIEEAVKHLGMECHYYSFKVKGIKMIVLDSNHLYRSEEDAFHHFDLTNLGEGRDKPHVTPEQLIWLKEELEEDCSSIIFTHATLHYTKYLCVYNRDKIFELIDEANEKVGHKKVLACFSGHSHYDTLHERKGTYLIGVPSMSNQWMNGHINTDIDEALLQDYPELNKVVPYKDPLYADVTVTDEYLRIKEKRTTYEPFTPEKYGQEMRKGDDVLSPVLKEKVLPL